MTVTQENAEALAARIVRARARLAEAAATADLRGIAASLDDLEHAYGQARELGVEIARPSTDREETRP
ncbi:hypothetical protein [Catenulispora subtropica]|uniref:Uncharacterized protein n=1 Tax=Catenulispora subtropica TaxID=450798 RepID=A0ABP5CMY0_9ACTN